MKRHFIIICSCLAMLLTVACKGRRPMPAELETAESLLAGHSDSALALLQQMQPADDWSEHDRMLLALLRSQAEDRHKVNRTSDSTMLAVADWFDRHGDARQRALAWFELGRISSDIGLTGQAIDAYRRALDTDTLSADSDVVRIRSKAAIWMGQTLMYQDLYAQAMPYFDKAHQLAQQCGDRSTESFALRDMARSYMAQGNTADGEQYYLQAAKTAEDNSDTTQFQAIQMELSDLYCSTEDFGKMKSCLDACTDYSGADAGIVQNQLANYYLALDKTDSAAMFFERVIYDDNPYVRRDATLNLADLKAGEGNFREAYELLAKSIYEDDSLTAAEQGQNANLIKTLSNKLEREKLQDRQLRRQTNIIYGLALAFVCLLLYAYFTIRHKNLLSRLQREKAERLMAELTKRPDEQLPKPQTIRAFTESEVYTSFHDPNFTPTLQDFHALEDALNATYDGCIAKIRQLHDRLKEKEMHLCMLEKAEVPNKLICADLGMEPNALSMLRARLYTKLFKQKGTADKFREFIKTL